MTILRIDGGLGDMGDTEVTVNPIVITNPDGSQTVGPPGEVVEGTKPKFEWGWLVVAGLAGLVIGWWLSEEDRRGGGPTRTPTGGGLTI